MPATPRADCPSAIQAGRPNDSRRDGLSRRGQAVPALAPGVAQPWPQAGSSAREEGAVSLPPAATAWAPAGALRSRLPARRATTTIAWGASGRFGCGCPDERTYRHARLSDVLGAARDRSRARSFRVHYLVDVAEEGPAERRRERPMIQCRTRGTLSVNSGIWASKRSPSSATI